MNAGLRVSNDQFEGSNTTCGFELDQPEFERHEDNALYRYQHLYAVTDELK